MKSLRAEALNVLLCFILGASMGGAILLSSSRSPPLPSDEATITGGDPGMEALQSIRDPVLRRHALFNVMSRLAVNDVPAALALLPHDDSRETLLVEWIEQRLLKQRPDIGAQAATTIRNEARRHQWLLKCLPGWRLRDDAKAAQWLRSVLTDSLAQAVADHAMNDAPRSLHGRC